MFLLSPTGKELCYAEVAWTEVPEDEVEVSMMLTVAERRRRK